MPAVSIVTQSSTTRYFVAELDGFFDGQMGVAESLHGQPLTFLTRVGVASPDSTVGEATAEVPEGTLVLLDVAGDDTRIAAVCSEDDAARFERWVRTQPEG